MAAEDSLPGVLGCQFAVRASPEPELAAEDSHLGVLGCQFVVRPSPASELAAEDSLLGVLGCQFAVPAERAHDLFGSLLPYISFSLQDFELFLQIEKRVLVRRGIIASPAVRALSRTPSEAMSAHIDFLIDQVERLAGDVFDQPW